MKIWWRMRSNNQTPSGRYRQSQNSKMRHSRRFAITTEQGKLHFQDVLKSLKRRGNVVSTSVLWNLNKPGRQNASQLVSCELINRGKQLLETLILPETSVPFPTSALAFVLFIFVTQSQLRQRYSWSTCCTQCSPKCTVELFLFSSQFIQDRQLFTLNKFADFSRWSQGCNFAFFVWRW